MSNITLLTVYCQIYRKLRSLDGYMESSESFWTIGAETISDPGTLNPADRSLWPDLVRMQVRRVTKAGGDAANYQNCTATLNYFHFGTKNRPHTLDADVGLPYLLLAGVSSDLALLWTFHSCLRHLVSSPRVDRTRCASQLIEAPTSDVITHIQEVVRAHLETQTLILMSLKLLQLS